MIDLKKKERDMSLYSYDYVFEKVDKFYSRMPFFLPKLEGDWKVALVEPKFNDLSDIMDSSCIPDYLYLTIIVDEKILEQVYLTHPELVKAEKTNWEKYKDLLTTAPFSMDDKVMRELYYRAGPREKDLREALNTLSVYPVVTMPVLNKHFIKVNRVFASNVVQKFLLGWHKQAWKMLAVLEQEVGSRIAFYAMRKYIRTVYEEKTKYLRNEETKEWIVTKVDGYTIIRMYTLFEQAASPEQLYPILSVFTEGRITC